MPPIEILLNRDIRHLVLDHAATSIHSEYSESKTLETVKFLDSCSISCIGPGAFRCCSSLRSIDISESVTTIGRSAFAGCKSLQSVNIPNGETAIRSRAFYGCRSLQSISIPNTVTTIDEYAFCGCASLQSVQMPDNLEMIGEHAFHRCTSLQSVHNPHSLRVIGSNAFRSCTSLYSVHIPNGVTYIGMGAFNGCTSLQSVHIPPNVTGITQFTFFGCYSLEQRQPDGCNYHDNTITWLRQRFNNIPIHQVCCDANSNTLVSSSPNILSTFIYENKQALTTTDAMGMTPLHILCCNPRATIEVMQVAVEEEPSLLTQTDVIGNTPLQLFLKCRSLVGTNQCLPSLHDLLAMRIKVEDLSILLLLNDNQQINLSNQDENTGLLPFMSAAVMSGCGLDVVFALAINNVNTIF